MQTRTFLLFVFGWLGLAQAAEISTVAGPEGLNNTFGVIVGPDGDIYFCDTGNHAVKKIDRKKGTVTTVAGTGKKGNSGDGGAPLAAELYEPYEVRFHPNGDLYWVEMQNHVVRKLDARTNLISTVAGTGKAGFSGDGGAATAAQMKQPHSIAFDQSAANLYICDIGNHRIRRVDLATGTIDTWCGSGAKTKTPDGARVSAETPLNGPRALDLAPNGDLWLALREGNVLYRIDMKALTLHHVAGTGKKGYTTEPVEAIKADLSGPKGVAVSPDGKWVYLADTESHTVRAVDLGANPPMLHSIAGNGTRGDGPDKGDPAACQMARLHGVGTDPMTGDVYIGDSETNKIRKITGLPGGLDWKPLAKYRTETFKLNGIDCRVTFPDTAKAGNPWIWRSLFYGAFPALDEALLASGWHVAWVDAANLYGGSEAMSRFDAFYAEVRSKYQLAEKPVLEGFSRGGLSAMGWSIQNPEKVLAVYLDAAVMDIHSWPKKSSPDLYLGALKAYGFDQSTAAQWKGPLDNLAPLAKAKVPIFIVAGGADPVVPYAENTGLLETRYREMGGPIEAIVKATCGHHPHGLYGPANFEIVRKLEKWLK